MLAHAVVGERHATARIVGVHLDIVVIDAVGRQQGHDAIGRQPAPVDELFQQGLAFRVHLGGRVAHHFIRQNGGERAGQVPGLEERAPVDIVGQGGQVDIFKHAAADELRFHGRAGAVEGHEHLVGTRLRQRQDGQRLLVGVLLADARVVEFDVLHILVALFRCQQRLRHGHGTRGVRHVDHGAFVVVRDFHCRVGAAGGGAADQQGNFQHAEVFVALHFLGDIRHFFQRRRDQAGQADDVRIFHLGAREDFRARHHHAHVDHFEVIALQDDGDDVLADVMHVAFHGRHDDLALRLGDDARALFFQQLFFLDVRDQMGHCLLHHARRFHHLRQEHFTLAKQVADHVHAGHQGALDHVDGAPAIVQQFLARFFRVFHDELRDAVYQRVRQPCLHRAFAPGQGLRLGLAARLQRAGDLDHALGGVFAAVQHHVFHALAQFRVEVVVHAHHAGVDDAHGHAGLDGVVQEDGMDGFAGRIVAAETERHVRHAARDLRVRQVFLDPARGVDEVDGVVVVLFDAGGDGKDVRVENDVFRREIQRIDQ